MLRRNGSENGTDRNKSFPSFVLFVARGAKLNPLGFTPFELSARDPLKLIKDS